MAEFATLSPHGRQEAASIGVARRRSERLQTKDNTQNACSLKFPLPSTIVHAPTSTAGSAPPKAGETFVSWCAPRLRMAGGAGKLGKRRSSPKRTNVLQQRRADPRRLRLDDEQRTKQMEDRPSSSTLKGKEKGLDRAPVVKKRKVLHDVQLDLVASETDDDDNDYSAEEESHEDEDVLLESDDSGSDSEPQRLQQQPQGRRMKKPVTLDINGEPFGNMKDCLVDDIKKYAKSLDPTANWESQPRELKSQLFKRLYKDWEMIGQCYKVSIKFVGPICTKVLITTRYRLNALIDAGHPKPADVTQEQWNRLVRKRSTEESQITSEHMRQISQGKGSKTAQLKAIEQDAIVKLALQHNRKPYQTEITDEVAREYTQQQLEKRKAALQKGADLEDVRTRVVDMEDTVCRLEDKVVESHKRMEGMLKVIMTSHGSVSSSIPAVINPNGTSPPIQDTIQTNLEGLQNPAPKNVALGQSTVPEDDFAIANETCGDGGVLQKKVPILDCQIEEFLKGLIQEPDDAVAVTDGAKSNETILLSGHNNDVENKVLNHGCPEVGAPTDSPTLVNNVSTLSLSEEDDMGVDSSVRPRRTMPEVALTKNVKTGRLPRTSKTPAKTGAASKFSSLPVKVMNAKKTDFSKKK